MAAFSAGLAKELPRRRMNPSTSRAQHTDRVRLPSDRKGVPSALIAVAIALLTSCRAVAQQPPATQGGASTGGVYAPVHDAEHRPITAGGFVTSGRVVFEDVSRQAGLTSWRYQGGSSAKE